MDMKDLLSRSQINAIAFAAFLQALSPETALARDSLTIGISQFPAVLNPNIDSMLAKSYIMAMTTRPLTAFGPDWKPLCLLCTRLPSFENGQAKIEKRADGKEGIKATYTLLPDAAWGDGTPVTTRDVLFTWQAGRHPQSGFSNAELYSKDITDITVADDKTFTIHFSKVFCDFSSIDDFHLLPEHLERKIFEADPAGYKNKTLYAADPANPGLYSGPYRIVKVDPGATIRLEQNPAWKGKKPYFETITVRAIENTAALSTNLLSGDIDYIAGELGLTVDQALALEPRLAATRPGAFAVSYKPSLVFEHMDINLDNPDLADVRVRRALLYAIDRKTLTSSLFGGHQDPALSMVNPQDEFFTDKVAQYPYDPARAESLLEEAGWKKGPDGLRHDASGRTLTVELLTTAGNKTRELVSSAIASDWKKIGVTAILSAQTPRVFFAETTGKRKFKDTSIYAWMSAPHNVPKTTLHSDLIPTAENNWAGQNYPGFRNAQADRLIEDLETVCAREPRSKLWAELQQVYAGELPSLPLYYRADPFIVPVWLKGMTPTGHMHPSTYWIENWSAQP